MRERRKQRRRKKSGCALFLFMTLTVVLLAVAAAWIMQPEVLRKEKNKIHEFTYELFQKDTYNSISVLAAEITGDDIYISKSPAKRLEPASLAKLFVIEYALTFCDPDYVVSVDQEALSLTKPGSSIAEIRAGEYYLHNLFEAMLVPSGNDAAYAVADYCGGILSPRSDTVQERIGVFMDKLNRYLKKNGYDTVLYDPSGYDTESVTTANDVKRVSENLLEYDCFRDTVEKSRYTALLPDGSACTWKNTNLFLDPSSEYYNRNVKGIKTGSMNRCYNMVLLYSIDGRDYLICTLGAESDQSRYDDLNRLISVLND